MFITRNFGVQNNAYHFFLVNALIRAEIIANYNENNLELFLN